MITGRPPKDPKIKLLEGNKGKREIDPGLQFEADDPGPPESLSDAAKIEWARLAPGLVEKGLLTKEYRVAFARYCSLVARCDELEEQIHKCGSMELAISKGYVNALLKHEKMLKDYAQLFGLDPVDTSRIKGIQPKKVDKFKEFLNRKPKSA